MHKYWINTQCIIIHLVVYYHYYSFTYLFIRSYIIINCIRSLDNALVSLLAPEVGFNGCRRCYAADKRAHRNDDISHELIPLFVICCGSVAISHLFATAKFSVQIKKNPPSSISSPSVLMRFASFSPSTGSLGSALAL